MRSDLQIQRDILDEFKWDPSVGPARIHVTVKNGIVTLDGQVENYAQKLAAERSARRITGVKAIAENIQIFVTPSHKKADTEIAAAILHALKWHSSVPEDNIQVKVEDGNVKLEGEVEWEYQRVSAQRAIEPLIGVRSVINLLEIKPRCAAADVHQKIIEAFYRSASIDAGKIVVEAIGSKIVLSGRVRSLAEKQDAIDAAWKAGGVTIVEDNLQIRSPDAIFEP